MGENTKIKQTRFRIYRSRTAKTYLCVVSARNCTHALQVARQMFTLAPGAIAAPETQPEITE